MIIAKQKRITNIAEYVLYIWQLEDIIRAYNLDINIVEKEIITKYKLPADATNEVKQWYIDFIESMKTEGLEKKGHVPHIKNLVSELNEFSSRLLIEQEGALYKTQFTKALPHIQQLIEKSGNKDTSPIEAALNGMYGLLMLKLSKKPISSETAESFSEISKTLAILADCYKKYEKGDICFD